MMPSDTVLMLGICVVLYVAFRWLRTRPSVTPKDAYAAASAGRAVVIDVREPAEWKSGVASKAELLSFSDLRGERRMWTPALKKFRGKRLMVYCHSGMRSSRAAAILRKDGYDAINIGTLGAWRRAKLPTRKP